MSDIPRPTQLLRKDKLTIAYIYPEPKGGLFGPYSLRPEPIAPISFLTPMSNKAKVILGLKTLYCKRDIGSEASFQLDSSLSDGSSFHFELAAAGFRDGDVGWSFLAFDPLIQGIYVPPTYYQTGNGNIPAGNRMEQERLRNSTGPVQNTYPVEPYDVFRYPEPTKDGPGRPTVITWIKGFKLRNTSEGFSIRINEKELALKNGLRSGKAITITGAFHIVSIAWFAFSNNALNICGGILHWPDDWPDTRPSLEHSGHQSWNTLIKVPKTKFQDKPQVVTSIAGINWQNEPRKTGADSLPEHDFLSNIAVCYEGVDQDEYVFSCSVQYLYSQSRAYDNGKI